MNEKILERLSKRKELEPIFNVMKYAETDKAEKNKYFITNHAQKNGLITELDRIKEKIDKTREIHQYKEVAELNIRRNELEREIQTIEEELENFENSPSITPEMYENMKSSIRAAYKDYTKEKAKEVIELLAPIEEILEEFYTLTEYTNNAYHVAQYDLFKDKDDSYFHQVKIQDNELNPQIAISHIIDKDRLEFLKKTAEGRRL